VSHEQPSNGRVLASWLWALVPGLTFGVGTAPAMLWAAVHKRSWLQGVLAIIYLVLAVTAVAKGIPPVTAAEYETLMGLATVLTLGGLVHGLVARRWVFDLPSLPPEYPTPEAPKSLREQQQAALEASREAAEARRFARELVADDPYRALELRIGRVDIPGRAFPDGGLIDVNNVPPQAFAEATELPPAIAERIAAVREKAGGFASLSELCALTELPPQTFDHVAERLVFPPKIGR